MNLKIGYLYGDLMNIYGDTGNIIALQKRAEWRGIEASVKNFSTGDNLKAGDADIFFFGGGQDQQQELVAQDLSKKGSIIKNEVERGVPLLSICGGYQLLGAYYKPHEGPKLPGIGLFPAYTQASHKRMIGNLIVNCQLPIDNRNTKNKNTINNYQLTINNYLVGFENHSGQTFLEENAQPLGTVIKGFGNNGEDGTEGCVYKNAIGCYMHGSLLPKNPQLADWFLKTALETKYGKEIELQPLDDEIELKAHNSIINKII